MNSDAATTILRQGSRNSPSKRAKLLLLRVWALLRLVDQVARFDVAVADDLSELEQHLIGLIGNFGAVTSTELVRLSGREKAQISHKIAALEKRGLIERRSLRAPITLSNTGRHEFGKLMERAERADASLTEGIPRIAVSGFLQQTQHLIDRAAIVLVEERDERVFLDSDAAWLRATQLATFPERLRPTALDAPMSLMVSPRLKALFAYLERGAALTYRRKLGLSLFETIIISHIADHEQLLLAELIDYTGRNKSQVSRTIKSLRSAGILEWIESAPGIRIRRVVVRLTPHGRELAEQLYQIACERDRYLMGAMSDADLESFAGTLMRLTDNASILLAQRLERSVHAA
jgi:DNA-binding MarR family transcriptional regulator